MVVMFRNPKDLCVSYYHFYRSSSSFGNFKGTWTEFVDMFKDGHGKRFSFNNYVYMYHSQYVFLNNPRCILCWTIPRDNVSCFQGFGQVWQLVRSKKKKNAMQKPFKLIPSIQLIICFVNRLTRYQFFSNTTFCQDCDLTFSSNPEN